MTSATLPHRREGETSTERTAVQIQRANSEPHPLWPPERKQGRFSSRKQTAAVRSDTVPQNRRQALVTKILLWSRNQSRGCQINQIPQEPCCDLLTKNIFSSRKALHPSRRCRFKWQGSGQTAVGGAFNFRQEYFQWATVFPICCSSQRATLILNFCTEQSYNGVSASPAA